MLAVQTIRFAIFPDGHEQHTIRAVEATRHIIGLAAGMAALHELRRAALKSKLWPMQN